ncbi:hypothetical protein D9756_007327 [Leucocoprinus leucothites]|uniref:Uncharacterized protein n=1 Tax=Leucocoprinus leucothites TaxID=201217 RepID=A0A8H5FZG3_9AGAR|nr:hypothetical protein D9756_007327 [Leucoagaricus leucothites]
MHFSVSRFGGIFALALLTVTSAVPTAEVRGTADMAQRDVLSDGQVSRRSPGLEARHLNEFEVSRREENSIERRQAADIAKSVGGLISSILEQVEHDNEGRGKFTQDIVAKGREQFPDFNWVACHTKHETQFDGEQGKDWGHQHQEFDIQIGGTIGLWSQMKRKCTAAYNSSRRLWPSIILLPSSPAYSLAFPAPGGQSAVEDGEIARIVVDLVRAQNGSSQVVVTNLILLDNLTRRWWYIRLVSRLHRRKTAARRVTHRDERFRKSAGYEIMTYRPCQHFEGRKEQVHNHNNNNFSPTTPHLFTIIMEAIARRLGEYHMDQVRYLPRAELTEHYIVEYKAWMERKVLLPPQDNLEKCEAFFAFCGEICGMQPVTPGDHVRITLACAGACQAITDRDMMHMDAEESGDTFALAWKYMERYYPSPATNVTTVESLPGLRLADGPSYDFPSPPR